MKELQTKLLPYLKILIGWPLSIVALFFIFRLLYGKIDQIKPYLSNLSYEFLGIGFLLFIIYFLLRNVLWLQILKSLGESISFKESAYRFTFSEIKRYVPGNIWSFLSRASLFSDAGINSRSIGIAIIADIQLVVIGCGLASLFSIPFILNSSETLIIRLSTVLPLSIAVIAIYFIGTSYVYKRAYAREASLLKSLFLPGISLNNKVGLSALSVLCYFVFGLANYFILYSLIPSGNILILSSFFVFSLLVGYLSFFSPMGLGVREAVVTLGLTPLFGATAAGFISIFTRITLMISELIFLLFVLIWQKTIKEK